MTPAGMPAGEKVVSAMLATPTATSYITLGHMDNQGHTQGVVAGRVRMTPVARALAALTGTVALEC